jgi:hypothetical protein
VKLIERYPVRICFRTRTLEWGHRDITSATNRLTHRESRENGFKSRRRQFLPRKSTCTYHYTEEWLTRKYYSAHGVLPKVLDGVSLPDLVIKVICPATETHIKKYTAQERKLVVETPEKYEKVVVPYIESFPPSRIEWYVSGETLAESRVYNILDGVKEAERVVHLDKDPETGFVLVPDLKWDQTSMKALVS